MEEAVDSKTTACIEKRGRFLVRRSKMYRIGLVTKWLQILSLPTNDKLSCQPNIYSSFCMAGDESSRTEIRWNKIAITG